MELFRQLMKKLNFLIIVFVLLAGLSFVKTAKADTVIDNGLNFLRSKQDATGRINTGFSAPSQWSAIAFVANGIDITTLKNPSVSLQDFLVSNVPSEPSNATDWETRILAIVATNGNPTNYGGVNYVSHLESFYNNNQIGDSCSLNDDIFGLLAEVSAGSAANVQIKQALLDYLILKQDPTDGGFGYSAPGCSYYSTSADMTAAAIQALVAAKNADLANPNLDDSINRAKIYLLANQDSDGGFGYYGSSDTDTSGWVLMGFNALGMQDSSQSANLRNWLINQQSADGGILAYDYGSNSSVSNASTTAQTLIGLAGKSWILKVFDPALAITPSSTITQSLTPTPTPDASSNSNSATPTPTPTVVPTATPVPTTTPEVSVQADNSSSSNVQPSPEAAVLGAKAPIILNAKANKNTNNLLLAVIFTGFGLFFTFTYLLRMFIMGKQK
jgi:hypothetical protein